MASVQQVDEIGCSRDLLRQLGDFAVVVMNKSANWGDRMRKPALVGVASVALASISPVHAADLGARPIYKAPPAAIARLRSFLQVAWLTES